MWRSLFLTLCSLSFSVTEQYEWQTEDAFDEIQQAIERVTRYSCKTQHVEDLFLPETSVSHIPNIKDINIDPVFPNRTQLLYIHNMALSRAFFWSYILQSRFIRPAINDTYDPGMMYYFLSTVADVSTNNHVNASAIYFSPNMSYSSSYRGFFNMTFPRFAPRTFRTDNFNNPIHLERGQTFNTFTVQDLGAVKLDTNNDYTSKLNQINEWYKRWLPEVTQKRYDTETTYQIHIRYANNTNETFIFYGPPGADENIGPVRWTRPYFDCGRSNRWLVAAVVPIADIYPRHTGFRHIEYPRYSAVSVAEMDYDSIDINQCPSSEGNKEGTNMFADTARCKKETTDCKPIHGWGFKRGGYQCRCKPQYRLPIQVRRSFLGEIVERATADQFHNEFDCLKINLLQKLPVQWKKASSSVRDYYLNKHMEYRRPVTGPETIQQPKLNIHKTIDFIRRMNKINCRDYRLEELKLTGDFGYGATEFFQNEAKMALRLANFISAFLQVSDPHELYPGKRVADRPLTEDQMIGETLALVMGNSRIWTAGTYWDRNKFSNRTFFAPYAYKNHLNTRTFYVEDIARLDSNETYLNKLWFANLKQRWSTNLDTLEKFFMKIKIRYNESADTTKKYEKYPNYYRGALLKHGWWTEPYYDCYGKISMWKIKYAAPFFGWDSFKVKLEFKGVVTVTMDLLKLDINQCPDKSWTPNAFKATDKCDETSSYCVPIPGRGFDVGGYKCECKHGYEYPFEDQITYFDGQVLETEFSNLVDNKETRFDIYKCRIKGASMNSSTPI